MIASESVATHPSSTAPSVGSIKFRPDSHGIVDTAANAFLILAVLLSACIAGLWFARKKGWLDRWVVGAGKQISAASSLQLEQALRLSPRTTLFQIRAGDETFLVVESTAAAQLVATSAGVAPHG